MTKERWPSQPAVPPTPLLFLMQLHLFSHPPLPNHYHTIHTKQHNNQQPYHPKLLPQGQENSWQSTVSYPQKNWAVRLRPYGIFFILGIWSSEKKRTRDKKFRLVHGDLPSGVSDKNYQ